MFIWDFVAETVLGEILDWLYGQLVGFLGNFFAEMGGMGAELFEMEWVQGIVLFFSYLGWALYGVGLVVAKFSLCIESFSLFIHPTIATRLLLNTISSICNSFKWGCLNML